MPNADFDLLCGIGLVGKEKDMWWISITIDVALVVLAFIFSSVYYKTQYGGSTGIFLLQGLHIHEVLNGKIFGVLPNFSNYLYNTIVKCIITIVCIVVIHFTDSLWITYLYMPYLLLTYWTFSNRLKHYKAQDANIKHCIKPALVASFIIPIFHTLCLVSLYITYLLNK